MREMADRACTDEKKAKIKNAILQTRVRRENQVCRSYECKIVERRLNARQREELKMLFVEGKWFYNHLLNLSKTEKTYLINVCAIKTVERFDKDHNKVETALEHLSAAQRQSLQTRMVANEKTIRTLVRKGLQKHGELRYKSELTCIPLRKYGQQYKFKSCNKVKIQGVHGDVLVRTGGQLRNVDELANANLVRKPDGYYLKITCFINKENFKETKTNGREIGLDFGIKTSITTSEGEKLDVSVEESDRLKKL